jgi:hypothetical protein
MTGGVLGLVIAERCSASTKSMSLGVSDIDPGLRRGRPPVEAAFEQQRPAGVGGAVIAERCFASTKPCSSSALRRSNCSGLRLPSREA